MSAPFAMEAGLMTGAPPVIELKRSWTPRVVLLVIVLPMAIGWFIGSIVTFFSGMSRGLRGDDVMWATILGLLGLATLALFAWRMWAEFARRAAIYDSGVEVVTYRGSTVIRWEEVTEIWIAIQRVRAGGLLGLLINWIADQVRKNTPIEQRGVTMTLRIMAGTRVAKLSNYDKNWYAAWQEAERRVNPRLIADAVRRARADEPVAFGKKISLLAGGLSFKGKPETPWSRIKSVSIKNGVLSVKIEDKWLGSGAMVAQIPNLFVLTAAITQLAPTVQMDVQPGINLAQSIYA